MKKSAQIERKYIKMWRFYINYAHLCKGKLFSPSPCLFEWIFLCETTQKLGLWWELKIVSEYYRKIIVYFLWHRFFSNIKTKATNFATRRSVIALLHTLWHVIPWLKSFSFVIQSDAAAKNSSCVIAKTHLISLLKRDSCLVYLTNVYKK